MKTLIICLLFAIIVISCGNATSKVTSSNTGCEFEVIEIDSCEYLMRTAGYMGYFSHKGNCKYCIERAKLQDE